MNRLRERLAKLEGADGGLRRFIVAIVGAGDDVTAALDAVGVVADPSDLLVTVRKPGTVAPAITVNGHASS